MARIGFRLAALGLVMVRTVAPNAECNLTDGARGGAFDSESVGYEMKSKRQRGVDFRQRDLVPACGFS